MIYFISFSTKTNITLYRNLLDIHIRSMQTDTLKPTVRNTDNNIIHENSNTMPEASLNNNYNPMDYLAQQYNNLSNTQPNERIPVKNDIQSQPEIAPIVQEPAQINTTFFEKFQNFVATKVNPTPEKVVDPNTTITLEEEIKIRKRLAELAYQQANIKQDHQIYENACQDYETATLKVIAGITTVGTILQEGGQALNISFEKSQELTQELKKEISKFDAYIKSISGASYLKLISAAAGLGLITWFGWKMIISKSIPSLLGGVLDIASNIPLSVTNEAGKVAAERTVRTLSDSETSATIIDLLKSPIMPITTITIASVSLVSLLVLTRSVTKLAKIIKKIR